MKWPISWTKISRTKPTANFQPQISAYPPTATKTEANFAKAKPNFAIRPTATAIGAQILRASERQSGSGWIGGSRAPAAARTGSGSSADLWPMSGERSEGNVHGMAISRPSASSSGPEKTQSMWIVASLAPP